MVISTNRFKLAQTSLHYFSRDLHLVVIYLKEEVNGFFENVVVNRAGNYRIFTDLETACSWLQIDKNAVVVK